MSTTVASDSLVVPNKTDDVVTFYHGTSPENASKIRTDGIDLSQSKPGNDFGDGFYITTSKSDALESAKMINKSAQDVVEFNVPKSELERLNTLKFDSPNQEWADLITLNKHMTPSFTAKKIEIPYLPPKEWLVQHDLIEEPLFRQVHNTIKKDSWSPTFTVESWSQRANQTSIHTEKSVNLFNKYMAK